MKDNLNLKKIRPGNIDVGLVARYSLCCDFCGYELEGNDVKEIVSFANDLGWRYDYENDMVICRCCQEEGRQDE